MITSLVFVISVTCAAPSKGNTICFSLPPGGGVMQTGDKIKYCLENHNRNMVDVAITFADGVMTVFLPPGVHWCGMPVS